jgi:hypothetical protein
MSLKEIMSDLDKRRFEAKFSKSDGCWLWTSGITTYGYGWFRPHGMMNSVNAHRVSYELYVGPIPENMTIDHLCKTKNCMNPKHMEVVSRAENSRRASPIQSHCIHGHPFNDENTYVARSGNRQCCVCYKIRNGKNLRPRNRATISSVARKKSQSVGQ